MKNKVIIILAILASGFSFCKKNGGFLDKKSTAELNETTVFTDSARTMNYLASIYGDIGFDMDPRTANGFGGCFSESSDESEGTYIAAGNIDKQITSGIYDNSFYQKLDGDWSYLYAEIRNINIFLKDIDGSPLSAILKARTKAEARFLRVWYYHFLMKYYAGIPLVSDKIYSIEDEPGLTRNTYEECVNYLVNELDEIAPKLPVSYGGLNYGRITSGACLALKSRILLFAASPFFNGGSFATNPDLIKVTAYPAFDISRWERAKIAAKAVIDLGVYNLNTDNTTKPGYGFYKMFIQRLTNEFIFSRLQAPGKTLETLYNPASRGGRFIHQPTQELVDMFPMINGKPITDPTSGYNENNPYVNRDPRFGYTVMYNESLYYLNSAKGLAPVYTYKGAPQDGIADISSNNGTKTGYYRKKSCDDLAAKTGGGNNVGTLPLIRYAEILLNYAEAANEVGQTDVAMEQLRLLRIRAGIAAGANGQYGLPLGPSINDARNLIQNERSIELAFEEHRYWDIRRWRIGNKIAGKHITGMEITKNGNAYTYKRIPVRGRYFKSNSYLFPLPQLEITLNRKILQNPGW